MNPALWLTLQTSALYLFIMFLVLFLFFFDVSPVDLPVETGVLDFLLLYIIYYIILSIDRSHTTKMDKVG